MLMHFVLDPRALDRDCFDDPAYHLHVRGFLKGVYTSGLLLVDANGLLGGSVREFVRGLPPKVQPAIQTLLTELVKGPRSHLVECGLHVDAGQCGGNASIAARQLAERCKADALLSVNTSAPGAEGPRVYSLGSYLASPLEAELESMHVADPLDSLSDRDLDRLLQRVLRHARRVRIVDRQIGRGTNVIGFRDGIAYLVAKWRKHAHQSDQIQFLEIITAGARQPHPDTSRSAARRCHEANGTEIAAVQRDLGQWLREQLELNVRLIIKEDRQGIMHRRILETDRSVFTLDRGFDLFRPGGTALRRNWLEYASSSDRELAQCSALPNVRYTASGAFIGTE
jgi:hypothetical protein